MMLGLEIVLENIMNFFFGDSPNFSTIFVFSLLTLILVISILGTLGRQGAENEVRFFERPGWNWVPRVAGVVIFGLLVWFTGQL